MSDSKPYVIHAVFVIEAASPDDAEEAVRSASFDDDLAPRWRCERTWWSGEVGEEVWSARHLKAAES